jgi:hypothetical protein
LSRDVGADTVEFQELGVDRCDQWVDIGVEFGDLLGELVVVAGKAAECGFGGLVRPADPGRIWAQRGTGSDEFTRG